MKRIVPVKVFCRATLATMLLTACVSAVAQQQPPALTHPSASSVQATPRTSPSPYGSAANAATGVRLPSGSITGFVYWQMNVFQPQSDCQGLTVKAITVNKSGMPLQLLSTTSALTASGPLTDYSAMGAPKYMLCSYSFQNMPERVSLRALLYGMPNTASVATPAAFQIPGGNCSSGPSSTLSFILSGGPVLCGDGAYNINFKLTAPASSIERSPGRSGLVPNAGVPPHGLLAQSSQNASGNSDTSSVTAKPTLLSAEPGASSPTPTQSAQQEKPGQIVAAGATRQAAPGTNSSATLTNADLTRMLKAGLAESVIISSIRSARKDFDFSSAGCQALERAGVSASILAVMGDGARPCGEIKVTSRSAAPGSKVELNPQPPPPGSKAAVANRVALKPIKLAPPKALGKITNPRLAEQNGGIIAVLQQQRAAAQQEAVAMKPSVRSVASAASVPAPVAARLQGSGSVQNFGPETTQSEKGKFASGIAHASAFNSIVIMCSQDPSPRIFQLSGGQAHGILTPEAKYNLYTITGCGFGPSDPGNSAYIFGVNGFKANLDIDFWSDNGITAHFDPWLAGVLDQDNVTLVVAPAGKQPFDKSGYKFYAARGMPAPDGSDQDVTLAYDSMPQASVSLFNANPVLAGYDQVPPNGTSQFPSFSFQGTPVAGWVFRYAYGHQDPYEGVVTSCFINDVAYQFRDPSDPCGKYFYVKPTQLGADTWDFSKLVPGFTISAYNLYYEDPDPTQLCGSWDDSSKKSGLLLNWDFNLAAPTQITVNWPLYWCQDTESWPSFRTSEQRQSVYGLAVWVLGPRCVDPWSGQKDQSCMNKVKQMLS